jgi:hypothetical protein
MNAWFLLVAMAAATPTTPVVAPWSEGLSNGADLEVEVVTFGVGDEIAEWFGHAAIVVRDRRLRVERLYNYGEYEFDPALALRYLQGHLTFHVAERPVDRTIALYIRKNRDVRVQTLDLRSSQKLRLATLLADNVRPENRSYLYDHYSDNCTTRIRDAVNLVTEGALSRAATTPSASLREHTRRLTAVSAVVGTLIDALLNDEVDRPLTVWEATFLPDEFEAFLATVQVSGDDGVLHPLVAGHRVLHQAVRPPAPGPVSTMTFAILGLLSGAGILLLGRWRRRRLLALSTMAVGVVVGIPGTVLFVMATLTDHHVAWANENLLFANPLTLTLLPLGLWWLWSQRRHARRPTTRAVRALRVVSLLLGALGVLAVVVKVLPVADQQNWRLLWLCVPPLAALAIAVRLFETSPPTPGARERNAADKKLGAVLAAA